ncbi:LCP family protein [Paludifilum halophilum]|uniref:LCP family protein n=1 Tax=Paludifilum halophilum TaxID=1642702 RepID=UPI00146D114A|nr:LCP family protein [Paludifilum halophilum]
MNREKSKKREEKVTLEDPFTVLLIGTDVKKASNENWRPDVLMVAAVNPKKKSIKMISIPRDTYTEIANANGAKNKINSSAYYGKKAGVGPVTNTVETVEELFNIPIDHYAKINFSGFIEIVDALGGVEVNSKFPFTMRLFNKMQHYEKGTLQLDGERALGYVRMRKQDPRGDLGRNERQREVLQELVGKMVSIKSVTKIDDILKSVGDNVTYSIKLNELPALQSTYREIPKDHIDTIQLQGQNSNDNPKGIWYYHITDQERLRVSHILQKQLDLPLETLEGEEFQGTSPAEENSESSDQQEGPGTPGEENPSGGANGTQPDQGQETPPSNGINNVGQ